MLRGNATTTAGTVIGITLVLVMLGILGILYSISDSIGNQFKENIILEVYMENRVEESEVLKLQKTIEAEPFCLNVNYISADDAARKEIERLGEDFIDFIGENPLPASLEVKLKAAYVPVDSVEFIVDQLAGYPDVREVDYHPDVVQQVNENVGTITLWLGIICLLFLLIVVALINNTINLAIFSKRFVIRSMQLVGATSSFIKRPYVARGIWWGIWSSVLALGMLAGMLYLLKDSQPDIPETIFGQGYFLYIAVGLPVIGVLISAVSTSLSVGRFLRMSLDQLH